MNENPNARELRSNVVLSPARLLLGSAAAAAFLCSSAASQNWDLETYGPTRTSFGMAYDSARDRVVMYGGIGFNDDDTYEFDGSSWSLITSSGPDARAGAAMAYQANIGNCVMFGGQLVASPFTHLNETWVWTGSTWVFLVQPFGPSGRVNHDMVYNAAMGQTVLFGGRMGSSTELGDTWFWNGIGWGQFSGPGPSPREAHAMAYDSARQRVVLFGGDTVDFFGNYSYLGDTWEFNGTSWSLVATGGPSPRSGHSMTYDASTGKVVLFGGGNGTGPPYNYFNDTWEWDGVSWVQVSPASSPGAKSGHSMVYDTNRSRVVMHGGFPLGGNQTWEYTTPAPCVGASITGQPSSQTKDVGQSVTFNASWAGTPPYSYTWFRNGVPLAGGGTMLTSVPYTIPSVSPSHAGNYYCQVTNSCGSATTVSAQLNVAAVADECTDALPLSQGLTSGSNLAATMSFPTGNCGAMGSDVWYTFQAGTTSTAMISFCAPGATANFDTVLAAFSGSCGSLTEIACNDQTCGTLSEIVFPTTAGATYYVAVGGYQGDQGDFTLSFSESGLADECNQALPIFPGLTSGSNVGATTSSSPASCGGLGSDVWYSFQATVTGKGTATFCPGPASANFDTVLAVFDGSCGSLIELGCNDDHCGLLSEVDFPIVAGRTYYIAVGGYQGDQGDFTVLLRQIPSSSGPALQHQRAPATSPVVQHP